MTPIRCLACGNHAWHRPGARFCTSCAAPVAKACPGCCQDVLIGDRFCGYCALELAAAAPREAVLDAEPGSSARPTPAALVSTTAAALASPPAAPALAPRPATPAVASPPAAPTVASPPAAPAVASPAPTLTSLPPDEIESLMALADAARHRAGALDPRAPVPAKRHLDQGDIDAMFG